MSGASPNQPETAREQHRPPHYSILKVVTDIFQPSMPPACFAVYAVLARRGNFTSNPNNSMRELAAAASVSLATVSRAIETLVYLKLIERTRHGGSQPDSYRLLDAWEAAEKWGAVYINKSVSYSLPQLNRQRLNDSVKTMQAGQRGTQEHSETISSVSPEIRQCFRERRQRATRETQMGTHLLQEERRSEEDPTPTPSHSHETQKAEVEKAKDFPDKEKQDGLLCWARDVFTGVMKDMGNHLLDASRPTIPHLTNGAADWQAFGFNSLAVEAAEWRDKVLTLVLSASDPAAARRGLEKYRAKWEAILGKWYKCEVEWELCKTKRTWWTSE